MRVIDAGESRVAATRVAAGMLAPVGELAFGEQEMLEMTVAAASIYPEYVEAVEEAGGERAGYRRLGALHVALDRDEAAELRRRHELQRSMGLKAAWLGPSGCRALEPGLHPSLNGGVHVADEAAVDPRRFSVALRAALASTGGEVTSGAEVVGLLEADGAAHGVRTADGADHAAGVVVVATGCWSGCGDWVPEAVRPPVRPVKGEILELASRDGEPICERIVASERVYMVPRDEGKVIVGATVEESGFDDTVTAGGVLELLRESYRLLPEVAELRLVEAAAGLRPATPDNLPVVGRTEIERLIMATGHYRNGVLLAPLTGEAVADLLDGGDPASIAKADPKRFAGRAVAGTIA